LLSVYELETTAILIHCLTQELHGQELGRVWLWYSANSNPHVSNNKARESFRNN